MRIVDQRIEFQRRIGRFAQLERPQAPHVGPSKTQRMERTERISSLLASQETWVKNHAAHRHQTPKKAVFWRPALAMFLAVGMGAASAIIAGFSLFQLTEIIGVSLPREMSLTLNILVALAIAFWLRELVSLSAVSQIGAQFAGILLALMTLHNVVHQIPAPFARLFSPEWVEHVTQTTKPGTLRFRERNLPI